MTSGAFCECLPQINITPDKAPNEKVKTKYGFGYM